MDIITEKREAIDVSGKTAVLSLKMLRKILAGDKVAIKRVQDTINAEEEYNYSSKKDLVTRVLKKPELFKSKIDKKKDMSLTKADKILQIRMTMLY